jgi:hypothetical protein
MALAGGRRIEHASREYEWVVRRRGNELRLVAQDVVARGQILVARFPVYCLCLLNEPHGEYYKRTPITPGRIRSELREALRLGWRPLAKRLPRLQVGSAGGWRLEDANFFRLIDGLWTVLDAICRDPKWRAQLVHNAGEFVPVSPEYVNGLSPSLAGRLAEEGELVVYVRDSDHGDATPHMAIRSLAWRRDLVLEDIAEWHQGWHRAEPRAADVTMDVKPRLPDNGTV